MANVSEELARLAQLRDQGVLSEEEFQDQKRAVLSSGSAPAGSPIPTAPKKAGLAKGCGILVLIGLGLIIIAAIFGDGGTGGSSSSPATSAVSAEPPLEVTATELFNAYKANEAAAQQQYGNRSLLVTGTVDGVDLDFSDRPVVKLATSNQFMSAQANLTDASVPRASELSKGQSIRLLCGSVGEVVGMPMLKDCNIQ